MVEPLAEPLAKRQTVDSKTGLTSYLMGWVHARLWGGEYLVSDPKRVREALKGLGGLCSRAEDAIKLVREVKREDKKIAAKEALAQRLAEIKAFKKEIEECTVEPQMLGSFRHDVYGEKNAREIAIKTLVMLAKNNVEQALAILDEALENLPPNCSIRNEIIAQMGNCGGKECLGLVAKFVVPIKYGSSNGTNGKDAGLEAIAVGAMRSIGARLQKEPQIKQELDAFLRKAGYADENQSAAAQISGREKWANRWAVFTGSVPALKISPNGKTNGQVVQRAVSLRN